MSAASQMQGARLEFVVRELKGKITRPVTVFDVKQKKLVHTLRSVDAGYMVYLPNGHSYRLTRKELVRRGYDRQPEVLNFDKVTDTKSPAGRFKFAVNMEIRSKAWTELEDEVIKACVRKHGPVIREEKVDDKQAA